ncbi:MAG: CBS domain-containing protein [Gaiellaceae bacterium]
MVERRYETLEVVLLVVRPDRDARRTDKETAVREIMSSPLIVATPQTTVDECTALMTDRRIRHLPVADGGEVVGIVSIGDLVEFQSKQQSFEIQYLTDYITAR